MGRSIQIFLSVFLILTVYSAHAQPDLRSWTAKFIVTHPNGVDSDTVWFGCDTAGGPGYQPGLDIIDTNFSGRIRILAYDEQVEADSGFGTCVNLRRNIREFRTGYVHYSFYIMSDSVDPNTSSIAQLVWDSTWFKFSNDSFSLDESFLTSEYGYIEAIDKDIVVISGIHSFDSSRHYTSGSIDIFSDAPVFECSSNAYIIKVKLTILWNYYQTLGTYGIPSSMHKLSVYPNPVDQYVHIYADSPIESVYLYAISGQLMAQKLAHGMKELHWDITRIPSGLYLLQVNTLFHSVTHKIIITHQYP